MLDLMLTCKGTVHVRESEVVFNLPKRSDVKDSMPEASIRKVSVVVSGHVGEEQNR